MVFKQIPTYSKMSLTTASFLNHVHNTGRRLKSIDFQPSAYLIMLFICVRVKVFFLSHCLGGGCMRHAADFERARRSCRNIPRG